MRDIIYSLFQTNNKIMKTILITGGAGFLGSHFAEKLIAMNHKVIVIDNLHTGTYENIINLESHENFIFLTMILLSQ